MKQMPQIQKVMTPMPQTIGKDIPVETALSMMREHRIRHLPVQEAGKLVGVLTDRDLKLAASFAEARGTSMTLVVGKPARQTSPEASSPEAPAPPPEAIGCVCRRRGHWG